MTSTAKQVVRMLAAAGVTDVGEVTIERTHAGHHQRSAGAWSWYAVDAGGAVVAASQWPIGQLVRAKGVTAALNRSRETHVLWPVFAGEGKG